MKKSKLFVVLCLIGVLALGGCGSSGASSATPQPTIATKEPPVVEPQIDPADMYYDENRAEAELGGEVQEEPSEQNGVLPGPGADETGEPEPEEDPSGIILMVERFDGGRRIELYAIDPNTGEADLFRTFPLNSGTYDYDGVEMQLMCDYLQYYPLVSEDLNWLAVTGYFPSTGEYRAGCIDADGKFFDITAALGLDYKGGFTEELKKYYGKGFMPGTNDFIYVKNLYTLEYSIVPLDNLTVEAVQIINDYPAMIDILTITDNIDDSDYLVEYNLRSSTNYYHFNIGVYHGDTGEVTDLLPENPRCNFDPVLSPDGTQVAFLSDLINGTHHDDNCTTIYTVPLEGGEPQLVFDGEINLAKHSTVQLLTWK